MPGVELSAKHIDIIEIFKDFEVENLILFYIFFKYAYKIIYI